MTDEEAIAALDKLNGKDPEGDHHAADQVLFSLVSRPVQLAVLRARGRAHGWWWG